MQILDGTGSGYAAKVTSENRILMGSVDQTEDQHAVEDGRAYNINTGLIALTGTANNALLYLKNNETVDLIVDAIAVGIGTISVTATDTPFITIVRNPTAGDIVSDATAVGMNANRNFGSSATLTADVFAGKTAGTMTGGTDLVMFQAGTGRLFAAINIRIPNGKSIGLEIDLNTSGGANVYAALVCHLAKA